MDILISWFVFKAVGSQIKKEKSASTVAQFLYEVNLDFLTLLNFSDFNDKRKNGYITLNLKQASKHALKH